MRHGNIRLLYAAMTYGLGRKLMLSFGAVLVSFVVVAFWVNLSTQKDMIAQRLDARTEELNNLLSEISSSYLFELKVSELEIILENIQRQPDIEYVTLIDPEGFIVATGNIGDGSFLSVDDHPSIAIVQENRSPIVAEDGNIRHVTAPIELGGDYLGTMRLGISLEQYQSDISLLQNRNMVIGAVFIAVGVLVSVLMSRRLTRPLRRLIELTRSARDGNLDQSLELATNDEIETLAEEFGEMLRALRSTMREINRLAYVDSLTGLHNRAWFADYLNRIVKQADTQKSAIIFLDLDRFKDINDTHGHDIGDHVLCEMSNRLRAVVSEHSTWSGHMNGDEIDPQKAQKSDVGIARLGGDEFTILLRDITDTAAIETLAQRIVTSMQKPFDIGRISFKTSASVGLAYIPMHGRTAQEILKSADVAMYQAKKAGRDTYCVFDPALAAQVSDRRLMEQRLAGGLTGGQLFLQFQPQFNIATGRPVGAEALIRWQHPVAGLIQPDDFLPIAEDAGLMGQIGRFVVTESLQLASQWPRPDGMPQRLAVNVSVRELSNRDFADFVLMELDRFQVDPATFELEITEGTAMAENAEVEDNIKLLRAAGIRFAVDDFGVGYSNLSRLKALQFETLKIDRSLLHGVGIDPSAEAVVKSLLQLSKALNLDVVAEGVERPEQLVFLQDVGCQNAQGYGLARPLLNDDFTALLTRIDDITFFQPDNQSAA